MKRIYLPPKKYYKSLPRKYLGSGALFLNEKEEILIVNPNYKNAWEIPGGLVEANESPQAACEREVREEIDIRIKAHQLLLLDFNSKKGIKGDSIMFLFFGEVLSQKQIANIVLDKNELVEFKFADIKQALSLVTQNLRKRLPIAMEAYRKNKCYVLENGKISR